jgi:hypothetical protein
MIDFLRKLYPDKSVFGGGYLTRIEDDRLLFKKVLKELGLAVGPYKVIKGFDALRAYLKDNPKKVIKTNIFRKDWESLNAPDYLSVKQLLINRQPAFGPYADEIQFIVEDFIDSVAEIGFDGFYNPSVGFKHFSWGVEIDKNLYIGKVGGELPEVLTETMDALDPLFKFKDYRGAFSTEERMKSKTEHFFIDPCCRVAMPLGVLYGKYIKNWAEVVYKVGKDEEYEIECDHKYVGGFALSSRNAEDYFVYINFKNNKRDDFRLMMAMQDKEGNYYSVKGLESIVIVTAAGDNPQEVVDLLKERAENVEAYGLENDEIKGINIDKCMENIKSLGLPF